MRVAKAAICVRLADLHPRSVQARSFLSTITCLRLCYQTLATKHLFSYVPYLTFSECDRRNAMRAVPARPRAEKRRRRVMSAMY
jgi:hypothetical protein